MKNIKIKPLGWALSVAFCALVASSPALADKPSGAGKKDGNNQREERESRGGEHHGTELNRKGDGQVHFSHQQHTVATRYYGEQFKSGHCPPGLAKKNNGCMPPGQAKKWGLGQP